MVISASGFPGGGLARKSTSSLQSQLKDWLPLMAHPEPVVVAGEWLSTGRPGLGLRACPGSQGSWQWGRVASQQESMGRALESRCPPCLPTLARSPPQHGHIRAPLSR